MCDQINALRAASRPCGASRSALRLAARCAPQGKLRHAKGKLLGQAKGKLLGQAKAGWQLMAHVTRRGGAAPGEARRRDAYKIKGGGLYPSDPGSSPGGGI